MFLLLLLVLPLQILAQNSLLFASCTLNSDGTVLNGLLCNALTASTDAGCLDIGKAYNCDANTWTWKLLT